MTITNKMVLPFSIKNNVEVSGGYTTELHTEFYEETQVVNYHKDNIYNDEMLPHFSPLQSPFTEAWVGGSSFRHINFNTGSDSSTSRPEGYHIELGSAKITLRSHAFRNSPPAYWTRDGRTKRAVNIANISFDGRKLGNYKENYEILQTSGRRITNNLIVDGFTATGVLTTQFITSSFLETYSLPDLLSQTGSKSVIVERFNAPGSKEESSRSALDREGEEISPNIALPWRNYKIRKPFYGLLSKSAEKIDGLVDGTIHGVHRNNILYENGRVERDNWYVSRQIPRSDLQYYWITASSITTALELGGYQSFRKIDGSLVYNRIEAFTDIVFNTGSLVVNGEQQDYEIDNYYLRSLSKDSKHVDLDTNTFSMSGTVSASFSEITNTNYYFNTWSSIRIGESPVARILKKQNYISLEDRSDLRDRIGVDYPKRNGKVKKYKEPPVTFKYLPLQHRLSRNGTTFIIKHDYANRISSFANKELIKAIQLSKIENNSTFYDILREQINDGFVDYLSYSYREIIWPREENTGLSRTRKREAYILNQPGFDRDGYDTQLGTQRVFWRDDQENRKRSKNSEGGYYSSMDYLSTEETGSNFVQLEQGILSDNKLVTFSSSFSKTSGIDQGIYNSICVLESSSAERELFYYTASVESQYYAEFSINKKVYNNIVKRGYVYDASGEFNNSFVDFYEQIADDATDYKKSIGSIYRSTNYKALLTALPQQREVYSDLTIQTEDEEVLINPKLRYVSFIGGGELNTGSFVQDENNFSNVLSSSQLVIGSEVNVNFIFENDLYFGGNFIIAGGLKVNKIAKWDTTNNFVSSIGSSLLGPVNAISVSGSDLYVGGFFTNNITKFDTITNTWSALGSGVNDTVNATIVSGSDVYAGGAFITAGGITANRIAKWDTNSSAWSALGSGVNSTVYTISVSGSDLYVGGLFTTAGGATVNRITKWDTNSNAWSALGSGVNGAVNTIVVSGSDIYAGGTFITAGGVSARRIAKWDINTSTWSPLGLGLNSTVNAICISGSDLYVGGQFSTAGGTGNFANYIAKWSTVTNTWSALGSGVNGTVNTIVVSGSDLYVGGNFTIAGEISASRIAKWNTVTNTWSALETNAEYKTFSNNLLQQNNQKSDVLFSTIDNGLQRITEIESEKTPFYDSYENFIIEEKSKNKEYSIISEFRISNNLEYYVKEKNSNFRSENKSFLELDGASGSFLSSLSRSSSYDQVFIKRNVSSDLLKQQFSLQQDNLDDSSLEKISIKIDGIKKLLPYNGFFPQDRTVQIANLYSDYVSSNLHGGIYNLSYKNDYFNDVVINDADVTSLTPNCISVLKYENTHIMAVSYPSAGSSVPYGRIRIYSSSIDDPTSWSSEPIEVIENPETNETFAQKLQLVSASNGVNLFMSHTTTGSSGENLGYIFHCSSSNLIDWSIPEPLRVDGSSPDVYISGSFSTSSFGLYFDTFLETSETEEKILLAIGSPQADPNGVDSGEVFIVTGTLNTENWSWSDKNLIYTGSQSYNGAGTGISIISCSSGYQMFFGESGGDRTSSDLGDVLLSTSSNGYSWSVPIAIASGSNAYSGVGLNDIKSIDFNNKTYVFLSEPYNNISSGAGAVFCVTSSENNLWPNVDTALDKKIIYTRDIELDVSLNNSYSYSISVFSGSDDRLYYSFANKQFSEADSPEIVIGYVDTQGKFQTSEDNSIFRYTPDEAFIGYTLGYNTIAVAPYFIGEYSLPIFFTDLDNKIVAIKNNIFTEFVLKVSGSEKYYKHAALEPFMAPGILYNTIKSGIAVDWPCATGSNTAIVPYGNNTIVNAYYPKSFEMANYSGSNIYESLFGNLRSNIDYRVPFENILFPGEAFSVKDFLSEDLIRRTVLKTLSDNDPLVQFIDGTYIYGGYEPYISPIDFGDVNNLGPKRFSVPFVYRKAGSQDSGLYTLAMSNFLAETVKFFLKDEKMTTFVSDPVYKWKEFNSNKTYYMDIVLEKSPELVMMEAYHSELHPTGSNGEKMNGRYFGYPVNKTNKAIWGGAEFTQEEKRLIHNDPAYAPYTPPYFEGVARARVSFTPQSNRSYTLQEIFNEAVVENIFLDVAKGAQTGSDAYVHAMSISASINIFGSAQSVGVSIDEITGQRTISELQNSQNWIISPRMETPVLDFSSQQLVTHENNYSKTGGFGRGMWSGYGTIPSDGKGIKIRLEDPFATKPSPTTGSLLEQVGLRPDTKNVGQIADSKLISEAIVVVPYLERTIRNSENSVDRKNKTDFEFIKISKELFKKQLNNYKQQKPAISPGDISYITLQEPIQKTSITEMIEKMQKYVIPPEMNFLQYDDIDPFVMYLFEFEHILEQQDLLDIWQGIMPKISYTAQEDSVSITHNSAPYELFEGNEIPNNLRWMVFKVKRKAEYNYFNITSTTTDDNRFDFNKIIGRNEGTDVYSYNWPYDFFTLVEFAKIELQLDYKKKE